MGLILSLTGTACVASGCQSIHDKFDIIQSQITTSESNSTEPGLYEDKDAQYTESEKQSSISDKPTMEAYTQEDKNASEITKTEIDEAEVAATEKEVNEKRGQTLSYEEAEEIYCDLIYEHACKRDVCREDDGTLGDFSMDKYPYGKDTDGRYSIYIMDKGFSDVGYKISDIDGDGIYELLLADINSSMIYEVFTLEGDTPKMVLDSWERCRIDYCGDFILRTGSNGAANQEIIMYSLDGDIERAELLEVLMEGNAGRPDDSIMYGYMSYKNDENDLGQITEDTFDNYQNEWNSHKCIVPDLKSANDYLTDRITKAAAELN